jgi:hypothetical protein
MTQNIPDNPGTEPETSAAASGPGGDAPTTAPDEDLSYSTMFREYLAGQNWIGAAEVPLVFHLRRLCQQLDASPDAPAAVSSAYLQAFSRLDRRRPGGSPGGALDDPGQTSIYDHMED